MFPDLFFIIILWHEVCVNAFLMRMIQTVSLKSILSDRTFLFRRETPLYTSVRVLFFGTRPAEHALKASLTIEASVTLPIFLFAAFMVFSMFHLLRAEAMIHHALLRSAETMAVYALPLEEGLTFAGAEMLEANALLQKNLPEDFAEEMIFGGRMGILCSAEVSEGDVLELRADYCLCLPVTYFGKKWLQVQDRVALRQWTGCVPGENADEGEFVYITPTGSVYHRDLGCRALRLAILSVDREEIDAYRNMDGKRYYPCSHCVSADSESRTYFITEYGTRYHSRLSCSDLTRTVMAVPITDVGGRRPCSYCAQ